jgi:uncharacterized protein (TIRG00374 family)
VGLPWLRNGSWQGVIFGVLVSLVFLGLFLYRGDIDEFAKWITSANYFLFVPALGVYSLSMVFRSIRWKFLLRSLGAPSFPLLLRVVIIGYMSNNVFPMRLGDIVRARYLSWASDIRFGGTLATLVVERIFDGLCLLLLMFVAIVVLPSEDIYTELSPTLKILVRALVFAVPMAFVGICLMLAIAANAPVLLMRFVVRMLTWAPEKLRNLIERLLTSFLDGLWVLTNFRRVSLGFLLSFPVWLSEAIMYTIIAYAFGLNEFFSGVQLLALILLVTAVANLATSIPSSPGAVGPFEFLGKSALVVFGLDSDLAIVYIGAVHFLLILPITVLGFFLAKGSDIDMRWLRRSRVSRNVD